MFVLHNVRMVPSNMRKKKIREPPNVTKVQSQVMLVLHNVRMVLSNVRKNKGTIECDKITVICDVGTIKCKKKNKGTIECDKSTVTCDIGIAQCEDDTIKCVEKKKELSNVTKVQSHMMLRLHNVEYCIIKCEKK